MTYIDFFKACALTSAAAPKLDMVEAGHQAGDEDEKIGINALQIRTGRNRRCVSYLSYTKAGKEVLNSRARSEALLEGKLDFSQKGIKIEKCLLEGEKEDLEKKKYLILICSFSPGSFPSFASLNEEECRSFGQGVGFLHSLGAAFEGFMSFSAPSIRFELDSWIKRLRGSGKIDSRILDAWEELSEMDALWDFSPSLIHGGWKRGQAGFAGGAVCSFSKWEEAQISDPARDLEWMFTEGMAQRQIDSFMQGYAMSMNDAMDPFILPRAKLWRQMKMGATLLEAQRKGEEQKALLLSQKLLRLSAALRSIAPQKPKGSLPPEALQAPASPLPPVQRGVKDLEEEVSLSSASKAPLPTSQIPSSEEKSGGEEKVEEIEEIEEEKVEEKSPADPALKSAMWRVVVRAALAKREGRDLMAEVEAEKRAQEEKSPQDRDTAILKQVDAPSESLSSLPASVHLKDGGSAMEKGTASSASTAYFSSPPSAPTPENAPHTGSQSQTKVIDRIDGNTNE